MKTLIVGAGQVGVSCALSVIGKFSQEILIYDNNNLHIEQLKELLIRSNLHEQIKASCLWQEIKADLQNINFVVLATPVDQLSKVVKKILPYLPEETVATDVGSLKIKAVKQIKELLKTSQKNYYYWWSHPGVGNEKTGPLAGQKDMYKNACVFLEKPEFEYEQKKANKHEIKLEKTTKYEVLRKFWLTQEAKIEYIDTKTHDLFFGITSHLQHVIVFSLMENRLSCSEYCQKVELNNSFKNAGTGLRNFTRVADANKKMWLPIFKGNQKIILEAGENYKKYLKKLTNAIKKDEDTLLKEILQEAQNYRILLKKKDDTSNPKIVRESLEGELENVSREQIVKGILLPYCLSIAITLNAKDLLKEKIDLSKLANPSFLDGTAMSLYSRVKMLKLLKEHKTSILAEIKTFTTILEEVFVKIENNDEKYLSLLIANSSFYRNQMPKSRRLIQESETNEAIRQKYLK